MPKMSVMDPLSPDATMKGPFSEMAQSPSVDSTQVERVMNPRAAISTDINWETYDPKADMEALHLWAIQDHHTRETNWTQAHHQHWTDHQVILERVLGYKRWKQQQQQLHPQQVTNNFTVNEIHHHHSASTATTAQISPKSNPDSEPRSAGYRSDGPNSVVASSRYEDDHQSTLVHQPYPSHTDTRTTSSTDFSSPPGDLRDFNGEPLDGFDQDTIYDQSNSYLSSNHFTHHKTPSLQSYQPSLQASPSAANSNLEPTFETKSSQNTSNLSPNHLQRDPSQIDQTSFETHQTNHSYVESNQSSHSQNDSLQTQPPPNQSYDGHDNHQNRSDQSLRDTQPNQPFSQSNLSNESHHAQSLASNLSPNHRQSNQNQSQMNQISSESYQPNQSYPEPNQMSHGNDSLQMRSPPPNQSYGRGDGQSRSDQSSMEIQTSPQFSQSNQSNFTNDSHHSQSLTSNSQDTHGQLQPKFPSQFSSNLNGPSNRSPANGYPSQVDPSSSMVPYSTQSLSGTSTSSNFSNEHLPTTSSINGPDGSRQSDQSRPDQPFPNSNQAYDSLHSTYSNNASTSNNHSIPNQRNQPLDRSLPSAAFPSDSSSAYSNHLSTSNGYIESAIPNQRSPMSRSNPPINVAPDSSSHPPFVTTTDNSSLMLYSPQQARLGSNQTNFYNDSLRSPSNQLGGSRQFQMDPSLMTSPKQLLVGSNQPYFARDSFQSTPSSSHHLNNEQALVTLEPDQLLQRSYPSSNISNGYVTSNDENLSSQSNSSFSIVPFNNPSYSQSHQQPSSHLMMDDSSTTYMPPSSLYNTSSTNLPVGLDQIQSDSRPFLGGNYSSEFRSSHPSSSPTNSSSTPVFAPHHNLVNNSRNYHQHIHLDSSPSAAQVAYEQQQLLLRQQQLQEQQLQVKAQLEEQRSQQQQLLHQQQQQKESAQLEAQRLQQQLLQKQLELQQQALEVQNQQRAIQQQQQQTQQQQQQQQRRLPQGQRPGPEKQYHLEPLQLTPARQPPTDQHSMQFQQLQQQQVQQAQLQQVLDQQAVNRARQEAVLQALQLPSASNVQSTPIQLPPTNPSTLLLAPLLVNPIDPQSPPTKDAVAKLSELVFQHVLSPQNLAAHGLSHLHSHLTPMHQAALLGSGTPLPPLSERGHKRLAPAPDTDKLKNAAAPEPNEITTTSTTKKKPKPQIGWSGAVGGENTLAPALPLPSSISSASVLPETRTSLSADVVLAASRSEAAMSKHVARAAQRQLAEAARVKALEEEERAERERRDRDFQKRLMGQRRAKARLEAEFEAQKAKMLQALVEDVKGGGVRNLGPGGAAAVPASMYASLLQRTQFGRDRSPNRAYVSPDGPANFMKFKDAAHKQNVTGTFSTFDHDHQILLERALSQSPKRRKSKEGGGGGGGGGRSQSHKKGPNIRIVNSSEMSRFRSPNSYVGRGGGSTQPQTILITPPPASGHNSDEDGIPEVPARVRAAQHSSDDDDDYGDETFEPLTTDASTATAKDSSAATHSSNVTPNLSVPRSQPRAAPKQPRTPSPPPKSVIVQAYDRYRDDYNEWVKRQANKKSTKKRPAAGRHHSPTHTFGSKFERPPLPPAEDDLPRPRVGKVVDGPLPPPPLKPTVSSLKKKHKRAIIKEKEMAEKQKNQPPKAEPEPPVEPAKSSTPPKSTVIAPTPEIVTPTKPIEVKLDDAKPVDAQLLSPPKSDDPVVPALQSPSQGRLATQTHHLLPGQFRRQETVEHRIMREDGTEEITTTTTVFSRKAAHSELSSPPVIQSTITTPPPISQQTPIFTPTIATTTQPPVHQPVHQPVPVPVVLSEAVPIMATPVPSSSTAPTVAVRPASKRDSSRKVHEEDKRPRPISAVVALAPAVANEPTPVERPPTAKVTPIEQPGHSRTESLVRTGSASRVPTPQSIISTAASSSLPQSPRLTETQQLALDAEADVIAEENARQKRIESETAAKMAADLSAQVIQAAPTSHRRTPSFTKPLESATATKPVPVVEKVKPSSRVASATPSLSSQVSDDGYTPISSQPASREPSAAKERGKLWHAGPAPEGHQRTQPVRQKLWDNHATSLTVSQVLKNNDMTENEKAKFMEDALAKKRANTHLLSELMNEQQKSRVSSSKGAASKIVVGTGSAALQVTTSSVPPSPLAKSRPTSVSRIPVGPLESSPTNAGAKRAQLPRHPVAAVVSPSNIPKSRASMSMLPRADQQSLISPPKSANKTATTTPAKKYVVEEEKSNETTHVASSTPITKPTTPAAAVDTPDEDDEYADDFDA